ncbi:MAG: hypothetical protein COU66_04405 [Candidatus Pacebacteria bacterium CG10_big_fil_rev_8_21_14_0_10_44_11]|nr:MAG: hypothetical protein COU66_04405 [Candidatus Pacebacteria bacterium CG10_big_fil_rev_8_21_14_0_10_44_11]
MFKKNIILAVAALAVISATLMWFVFQQTGFQMGSLMMWDEAPLQGKLTSPSVGSTGEGGMMGRESIGIMPDYYPYPSTDNALDYTDRSVQKYSSHSVVVGNVDEYLNSVKAYVASINGVVLSYDQGTGKNQYVYGSITAKVPVEKFDEAVDRVTQNVQKVVFANVSAQDVTGQVVSLDEQIQSFEDQKAQLEINLDAAKTDAEKRSIQLQIAQLDRQITRLQQSASSVAESVQYATMNISVSNREYYFTGDGPRPVMDVLQEAWFSLQGTGFGLVYFLIWIGVYAIIWLPVLLLARWIWGKVKHNAPKLTK